MDRNEPAPWPIMLAMTAATAAFFIAGATNTDVRVIAITWFFAGILGGITLALAAQAARYRIKQTASNRQSRQ